MPTKSDEKIDLYKLHKDEYAASTTPALVKTKPAQYLVVRGHGAPGGEVFQSRIEALYGMAYTMKFQSKFAGRDYSVCKLEALYGVDGQSQEEFQTLPQEKWKWRLMIRVPDFIRVGNLEEPRSILRQKGKQGDFDAVELNSIDEGQCVQMLHIGPYEDEARTIAAMREFADQKGLVPHMWHHEIYLSDPRRVAPAKLRTILRQPVQPK